MKGKLTNFIKNNPKVTGALVGGLVGGTTGYVVDRKAKRTGNKLKRNAGLVGGTVGGAVLGSLTPVIAKKANKFVAERRAKNKLHSNLPAPMNAEPSKVKLAQRALKALKSPYAAGVAGAGIGTGIGHAIDRKQGKKFRGKLIGGVAGIGAGVGTHALIKKLRKHSDVSRLGTGISTAGAGLGTLNNLASTALERKRLQEAGITQRKRDAVLGFLGRDAISGMAAGAGAGLGYAVDGTRGALIGTGVGKLTGSAGAHKLYEKMNDKKIAKHLAEKGNK